MPGTINWFEISVSNFERAKNFYETILDAKIEKMNWGSALMGFFSVKNKGDMGGAIVQGEGYIPSDKGVLIFFEAGDDLNNILSKIENAGGKVVLPKTLIKEDIGYYALFNDTEGNKLALHSAK